MATARFSILATGTLSNDPKQWTMAASKTYATASLRVPAEDADGMLVSVIAFAADAVPAIPALTKGDSCSIAGRAKLPSWEKDGEQKHGFCVVADKVLTVYQSEKKRRQASQPERIAA